MSLNDLVYFLSSVCTMLFLIYRNVQHHARIAALETRLDALAARQTGLLGREPAARTSFGKC